MLNNIEKVVKTITSEISSFTEIAVIGLSGGADSTLVATLCSKALCPKNVYGLHLPHDITDEKTFNNKSRKVAGKLGICEYSLAIRETYEQLEQALTDNIGKLSILNKGNIKARIRMSILYCTLYAWTCNSAILLAHPAKSIGAESKLPGSPSLKTSALLYAPIELV